MIDLTSFTGISDEDKAKLMALSRNEDSAYEAQIKNLTKQAKAYGDYDDLKLKLSEADKQKAIYNAEVTKIKKDFALEKQLASVKVGNEKLVRKLLDTNALTYDEASGTFTDLTDKVNAICDEYGIAKSPEEQRPAIKMVTPASPVIVKNEGILEVPDVAISIAKTLGAARLKQDLATAASSKPKERAQMPRFIQAPMAQMQAPVVKMQEPTEVSQTAKSGKANKAAVAVSAE